MAKLLVLHHAGFAHIPAVFSYVDSFRQHSRHQVSYFNVNVTDEEKRDLDFNRFDAVFLNYCACRKLDLYDPAPVERAIQNFGGVKIVALQDEYDNTNRGIAMLERIRPDIALTCIPLPNVYQIYPLERVPFIHFENVLTGYIDAEQLALEQELMTPLAARSIVIGYRGREVPFRCGDLAWHKAEVGRRFLAACDRRSVACDIAIDEHSRIYSDKWMEFVRSCRVMLGSESGSNVFDFDGSLHETIKAMWKQNPALRYEDVRELVTAHECGFHMGQISPRIFEAVISKTAMALMRGDYSGVLEPRKHYVPIELDYSNIDDVLDQINDVDAMQAMADRAYADVVGNERCHFRDFVARIDTLIDEMKKFPQNNCVRNSHAIKWLPTTRAPLGNDPYLHKVIMQLTSDRMMYAKHLRAALDGKLVTERLPDRSIRMAAFD